jgi:hypothetical protein
VVISPEEPAMNLSPSVDLEPIRQALLREAQGRVALQRIDQVLQDLLAHEFRDARVSAYVPILLHRAARESLWS